MGFLQKVIDVARDILYNKEKEDFKEIEGVASMNNVFDVCDFILLYEQKKGRPVTNLRLQKLLYFIQGRFLVHHGDVCFESPMEAWRYGPVIPDVYAYYKQYGSMIIPPRKNVALDQIRSTLSNWQTISDLLDDAKDVTSSSLVDITHVQPPWKNNYGVGDGEISITCLRRFFCEE